MKQQAPTGSFAPSRLRGDNLPRPANRHRLRALQSAFAELVMHPGSVGQGAHAALARLGERGPLERVLTAGPRLAAIDRVRIYHHAYRARLRDCLRDDFEAVAALLGDEDFMRLADAYLAAHPSSSPDLNRFGARLPAFLAATRMRLPHRAFAADLARLEWALVEAIHAPLPPVLDRARLAAIPPARWARQRFVAAPSVRLLRLRHDANGWFQAWRSGQPSAVPAPAPAAVLVLRTPASLWRMALAPEQADLLQALLGGEPLGLALDRLAAGAGDPAVLAQRVMRWFGEWVAAGTFADLRR